MLTDAPFVIIPLIPVGFGAAKAEPANVKYTTKIKKFL
jgi:hypothetical protein